MPVLSQLLGRPVVDADGVRVGYLRDLVAAVRGERIHPEIVALVVRRPAGEACLPASAAALLAGPSVALAVRGGGLPAYAPAEHDIFLERDILDKQIIDIDGVRVVRVNDLELARVEGAYYVANVDVSPRGLMRRLLPSALIRFFPEPPPGKRSGMISWEQVELPAGGRPMRLRVPGKSVAGLHPADLAEIISGLTKPDSTARRRPTCWRRWPPTRRPTCWPRCRPTAPRNC
jgi:magnesium transporter